MEPSELFEIIGRDEDTRHQFKANITNVDSLAAEMVAMSNAESGGRIFIGVTDEGQIAGLNRDDMNRLNKLVANAASQSVRPPINPITENIAVPGGLVMVVTIPRGISRPYLDNKGAMWVKSGADKRKVTAREEMQRIFQQGNLIHADEVAVTGMTAANLDLDYFKTYYKKEYDEELDQQEDPLPKILENMNLMKDGFLNKAGALLFAKNLEFHMPGIGVKCAAYAGDDVRDHIDATEYRDSEDIYGKLEDVFKRSLGFVTRNLRRVQRDRDVNSLGELEIPKVVLEELLVNALVHRDYFVSAAIRVFIFDNKMEIISPGHLPNNLTVEKIKSGISIFRNPILVLFASNILPYRGMGRGIRRALKEYPDIELIDHRENNEFKVIIKRVS